jgi:hypothetical protein
MIAADAMTVRIDPSLRTLFRQWRQGGAARAPDAAPPAMAPARPAAIRPPGCAPVRLRRDGHRPLAFRGLKLASRSVEGALPGFVQKLGLWLTEDGAVALEVALTGPAGGWPRSRHEAAIVTAPDGLADFLARVDPAAGLPDPTLETAALPDAPQIVSAALRAEFRALVADLCPVLSGTGGPGAPMPDEGGQT